MVIVKYDYGQWSGKYGVWPIDRPVSPVGLSLAPLQGLLVVLLSLAPGACRNRGGLEASYIGMDTKERHFQRLQSYNDLENHRRGR